jgi:hypothetical protein
MLYHGSEKRFDVLKRHQARGPSGTPAGESLNTIYFTPDFAFAFVTAAGPEGVNEVNHDEKTVRFENPRKFNPEKEVYIYVVDPSMIPNEKKILIDPWQVAVDLDEIIPAKVETHKAGEISQYYIII